MIDKKKYKRDKLVVTMFMTFHAPSLAWPLMHESDQEGE